MRKNTARHWLHACLDLLPVLLIPVFMIYSHRHSLTERTQIDIQYKYQTNEVNNLDDLIEGNLYHFNLENDNLDNYLAVQNYMSLRFVNISSYDFSNFNLTQDDLLLSSYDDNGCISVILNIYTDLEVILDIYLTYNTSNDYLVEYSFSNFWDDGDITFIGDFVFLGYEGVDLKDNSLFSISTYNEIESVDVQDTNSDIMSVFMDDFNHSINTYFNMGNVFGMNNVYEWFNVNIFGGNAPTIIFSVWNIVLYEFVMDLIFLLYALFMWFIDVTKRLIEKPLDSIK